MRRRLRSRRRWLRRRLPIARRVRSWLQRPQVAPCRAPGCRRAAARTAGSRAAGPNYPACDSPVRAAQCRPSYPAMKRCRPRHPAPQPHSAQPHSAQPQSACSCCALEWWARRCACSDRLCSRRQAADRSRRLRPSTRSNDSNDSTGSTRGRSRWTRTVAHRAVRGRRAPPPLWLRRLRLRGQPKRAPGAARAQGCCSSVSAEEVPERGVTCGDR
eukprot:scaffold9078_cov63-Phaeocystis_antarctica.AAC.1